MLTFRATGITIYLANGGTLEKAQMRAAHESPRTTKLYDGISDAISLDEVERVVSFEAPSAGTGQKSSRWSFAPVLKG
jgi:hypothetical protein